VDWAGTVISVISAGGIVTTKQELGETRTQRLERFALRGAAVERQLHETKQAIAAMTQRAEQAEREANSWIQAADDERTKLRHALAIARGRAEAAEAAALAKGNEWAQSIHHATVFRERWEAAEAKLAAIPLDALLYCFRTEIEEREFEDWELYSDAIDIWIDTIVADRLAQLRPSKEAQP